MVLWSGQIFRGYRADVGRKAITLLEDLLAIHQSYVPAGHSLLLSVEPCGHAGRRVLLSALGGSTGLGVDRIFCDLHSSLYDLQISQNERWMQEGELT